MVLVSAFVFSGLLVTYCTQSVESESDADGVVNTDEILHDFQTVGLLHNTVMAEVLDDFKRHDNSLESREDYFDFMEKSLVTHLASKDLVKGMSNSNIHILVSEELDRTRYMRYEKPGTNKSDLQSTTAELEDELSPQQLEILHQIDDYVENAPTTEDMIASLEMVNNSPEVLELDYDDRWVIYAATSIGIESAEYWSNNFEDWVDVLMEDEGVDSEYQKFAGNDFLDTANWFSGRSMINADIAGGVAGAVGGCLGGMLLGGAGCVPGAATGGLIGSASGSVGNAVSQILSLFSDD